MSQIIACKSEEGIILAADSKAIEIDLQGNWTEHRLKRLIQLTPYTAILTGGAMQGAAMCESLKDFIGQEKIEGIEDVYQAALPFMASEYEHFMRKKCEFLPVDPIHQVHFILAGYSHKNKRNPFQLYLLWTKKKLPQIDGDEISTTYAVPRRMTLEYHLNQQCQNKEPLDQILPRIRANFAKQSELNDDVNDPFSFAFIKRDGFADLSDAFS